MDKPKDDDQEDKGSAIYAVWYDDSIDYLMGAEEADPNWAVRYIVGYASGSEEDILTLYSVNIPYAYLRLEELVVNRVTPEMARKAGGIEGRVPGEDGARSMSEYRLDTGSLGAIVSNITMSEYDVRKAEGADNVLEIQRMWGADRPNGRLVLGPDCLAIQIEEDEKGYCQELLDAVKRYIVIT